MWLTIIILIAIVALILVIGMRWRSDASGKPTAARRDGRIGVSGAVLAWAAAAFLSGRHNSDHDHVADSTDSYDDNSYAEGAYEEGYEDGYDDAYDSDPEEYYDDAEQYSIDHGYDIYQEYEDANAPEEYDDSY